MHTPPPPSWYTDADALRRERAAIFGRSWLVACHGSDVAEPGDYVAHRTGGREIVVLRGLDGTVRAFFNVCQHRAHRLLDEGRGRLKASIACPYHAWTYGLDGTLRVAPHADEVPGFDRTCFGLEPVRTAPFAGFVLVCFDRDAPEPAATSLGVLETMLRRDHPRLDAMRAVYRREKELQANWKVIVENYLECYHCDVAHPSFGNFNAGTWKHVVGDGWSRQGRVPEGTDDDAVEHGTIVGLSAWWQWPNVFWARAQGPDSFVAVTHEPLAPDRTRQVRTVYALDGVLSPELRTFNELFDEVFREDTSVVENVQRGLASPGYRGGVLVEQRAARAAWSEHGVRHFQDLVRKAMASPPAAAD
jgi:choline monooxygenase